MDEETHITVSPAGNRSRVWPWDGEPAQPSSSGLPTTNEELREAFVRFLRTEIAEESNHPVDPDNRKNLWAALAAASDPTLTLQAVRIDRMELTLRDGTTTFTSFLTEASIVVQSLVSAFLTMWKRPDADSRPASQQRPQRPAADISAQRTVPFWYGSRCVLTGVEKPEGAHIVPVRVTKTGRQAAIWAMMHTLWHLDSVNLGYLGRERENILPLSQNAHLMWDRGLFLLRPVPDTAKDPAQPATRLYLQMIWADDLVAGMPGADKILASVVDGRRPSQGMYPPVVTGDTVLLETTDAEQYPLPNVRFLQIRHGVDGILGGLRTAAALENIFSGHPPADDDDDDSAGSAAVRALDDEDLLPLWRFLLDAAMDRKILDEDTADGWARVLVRQERCMKKFWLDCKTGDDSRAA